MVNSQYIERNIPLDTNTKIDINEQNIWYIQNKHFFHTSSIMRLYFVSKINSKHTLPTTLGLIPHNKGLIINYL